MQLLAVPHNLYHAQVSTRQLGNYYQKESCAETMLFGCAEHSFIIKWCLHIIYAVTILWRWTTQNNYSKMFKCIIWKFKWILKKQLEIIFGDFFSVFLTLMLKTTTYYFVTLSFIGKKVKCISNYKVILV